MKIYANQLKRIIQEELSLLTEGCGEAADTGEKCSACSSGHACPCADDHNHEGFGDIVVDSGEDEKLLSKVEALRIVTVVAQNTSCPVTRSALLDVVEDLGVDDGEEWSLDDSDDEEWSISGHEDEEVDVDWSNPQYGHFRGDIGNLESKDDAFGVGFSMGQSGDFPQDVDQKRRG